MSSHGVRNLTVKVVGCTKLKDTNWITKQNPFVCIDYGGTKFETKPCKGGHKTPYFREEFEFILIEGISEINVTVWNCHSYTKNTYIGNVRVKLEKVLSRGTDDSSWALVTLNGSAAGEVQLTMHYSNTNAQAPMANPPQPTPPHHYHPHPSSGDRQPQPYSTPPQQAYHAPHGGFFHNGFQRPTSHY